MTILTLNSITTLKLIISSFLLSIAAFGVAFFLVKDHLEIKKINLPVTYAIFCASSLFLTLFLSSFPLLHPTTLLLLLFSFSLMVTAHTDAQTLLISPLCTVYLIPCAFLGSYLEWLPSSLPYSVLGATVGTLTLWTTAYCARRYYGTDALGQGDIDLLACIGAFLGSIKCLRILFLGSLVGSLWGIVLLLKQGKNARSTQLPFGTFLALAGLIEILTTYKVIPQLF